MAKSIEPKLLKIGEYLKLDKNAIFTIPEYQRPYSWEISHCDKLWQDINGFMESDSKDSYFFGTIIINCYNNDESYGLIDGQQRTTTFLLLLKALLIRINAAIGKTEKDEESENLCRGLQDRRRRIMGILYKVEPDYVNNKPNRDKDRKICESDPILKNESINELYKTELQTILSSVDYTEAESSVIKIPRKQKDNKFTNFFRNFKFFYNKAGDLSASELNKFTKTLIEGCEVIEIKSWQVEQAITMFNSLNSDGLPLYDADIISAKLYAVAEKNNTGDQFTKLWKELLELIDELKQKGIADIDAIFMQQMYFERAKNNEYITETGSVNATTPGLRRYFTEISKDLLKDPIGLCNQLVNLAKIWKAVSVYPFMQVLLKLNVNTKLFLASYFHRFNSDNISKESVKGIAECLLRLFTLLELVDIGFSSSAFKIFLFGEIAKIADEAISMEEIKSDFDKHIKLLSESKLKWTPDKIKEFLIEYSKNTLVYLNEYLFAEENGFDFEIGPRCEVEHIMPSSGANLDTIRQDAHIENSEDFDNTVNMLGNKILLEENINRSIGNEWFATKVSTKLTNKTGYIDSSYPLANALVDHYKDVSKPYWCKEDIEAMTDKASDRIVKFIFG